MNACNVKYWIVIKLPTSDQYMYIACAEMCLKKTYTSTYGKYM